MVSSSLKASTIAAITAIAAVAASTASLAASDQALPTRHILTLEVARRVLATAEDAARQHGAPGVIAVVDAEGYLIAMERMDGSPQVASVELAPAKARTAALFSRPTEGLEDAIHAGRVALTTSGFVDLGGGVPLVVDGEEVGAIGVSTALPQWDGPIAAAAAASLAKRP
jgi:glc operon protein GlcG